MNAIEDIITDFNKTLAKVGIVFNGDHYVEGSQKEIRKYLKSNLISSTKKKRSRDSILGYLVFSMLSLMTIATYIPFLIQ